MRLLPKVAILCGFCFSLLASGLMAKPVSADVPYTYDQICIDNNKNEYKCGTFTCGNDYPEGCHPECPTGTGSCYATNYRELPVKEGCTPNQSVPNQNPNVCQAPPNTNCNYDNSGNQYSTDKANNKLDDKHLSPEMLRALKAALAAAKQAGIDARVGEAYRTPERADVLYQDYINKKGGRAAPAWGSAHNYGLAVDILLVDSGGNTIHNNNNGDYTRFAKYMKAEGFTWFADYGKKGVDDGHFEYNPAITGLMSAAELKAARDKVISEMGLPDVRCTEWWTQFWYNLQNVVSRPLGQPLSSGDNLASSEASDPGFGIQTNEEQTQQEELREEIEEDVDECDLDPEDPWCASLR